MNFKNKICQKISEEMPKHLTMNTFLTDEERISLQKQHKKESDGQIRDRIKVGAHAR